MEVVMLETLAVWMMCFRQFGNVNAKGGLSRRRDWFSFGATAGYRTQYVTI